ncbi:FAD-dependent oxidoreductase [Chryseolinea sp. T2]|uniref:FAD-dependent oxidoreductase n=1 Tax=Chryseolinea sp. T2 TaxID=3129255 RepID=UPI00307779F5
MKKTILIIAVLCFWIRAHSQQVIEVDVCVYGGTSAGVIAAYTAQKLGKKAILIEPGQRLGGMTSGGLGYTDIGNKYAITGLARDFYRRIGQHYGKFEQWTFEPKVAEQTFKQYVKEGKVQVVYQKQLRDVKKNGTRITEIILEDSENQAAAAVTIRAKMFIDCGYEGDLMAKADVSYFVGREANADYNETINGVQLMDGHQVPNGIDPYKEKGRPESGLIWGVSDAKLEPSGTGDKKIQAYNYRICLTSNASNMIAITRPSNYDSTKYELAVRVFDVWPNRRKLNDYFIWSGMPNQKTDINNRNGFSTDMIGMNYEYPGASHAKRKEIIKAHEDYTKGLLYFYGHDPRVPKELRDEMLKWGYPKDEYTESGNWSPQLYVREARRMVGKYVMTQSNCEGKIVAQDAVGMAAYTMDSHNCQRLVVNGQVKNEGNVEVGGFGPYPISYGALVPKSSECTNLLVPVCLSGTHIAYGSIRMEPVFMVLAQSSATAAVMAIDTKKDVQDVNIPVLQKRLQDNPLADGSAFDILVDNDNEQLVTKTGEWNAVKHGGYGPSFLASSSPNASVVFKTTIARKGKYECMAYIPKIGDASSTVPFTVTAGKQKVDKVIKSAELVVVGQTSGEWVSLGAYTLAANETATVEVSTKNADGKIVADAIIWTPVKK